MAAALSEKVSGLDAFSGLSNKFSGEDFLHVLVEELASHKGKSAISAGLSQSADVHAVVAAINTALANNGKTVNYLEVPFLGSEDNNQAFKALISDMKSGTYDAVVFIGTNPVLTAPADLDVNTAMDNTSEVIHLSTDPILEVFIGDLWKNIVVKEISKNVYHYKLKKRGLYLKFK